MIGGFSFSLQTVLLLFLVCTEFWCLSVPWHPLLVRTPAGWSHISHKTSLKTCFLYVDSEALEVRASVWGWHNIAQNPIDSQQERSTEEKAHLPHKVDSGADSLKKTGVCLQPRKSSPTPVLPSACREGTTAANSAQWWTHHSGPQWIWVPGVNL